MKKSFLTLLSFLLLLNCATTGIVLPENIDNSRTLYEHYLITLKSGEKIKGKYVFNRGKEIEVYAQGRSLFIPIEHIENIKGISDSNSKGMLILSATVVASGVLALILVNNGATVTYGNQK